MKKATWLGMMLGANIVSNIIDVASDSGIELVTTAPHLPAKRPQQQQFYESIFIQATEQSHQELELIMIWYSQISWWHRKGKESSLIIFLPRKNAAYANLLEASLEPLGHSQAIRLG